jgi:hypothetical protein
VAARPCLEVRENRLPAELHPELGGVNGVAQVVAGPIRNMIVCFARLTHQLQDRFYDLLVAPLAIGADQICLADLPLGSDQQHCSTVIIHMNPVPYVEARAVELWPATAQDVGDLARNELLDMLIRPVVVRAVAQCGLDVEGTYPSADQVI